MPSGQMARGERRKEKMLASFNMSGDRLREPKSWDPTSFPGVIFRDSSQRERTNERESRSAR